MLCLFILLNWCFCTVVLEKTLESPLDCKVIQQVHPKGDQSWVFFGRTDAEAETPILWPSVVKSWLIWKDPNAGRDWGQEEKGTTGWDGWMASLTQWTGVWVNSGRWWWIGKPGMVQSMGSQSRTPLSDWTELNWVVLLLLGLWLREKLCYVQSNIQPEMHLVHLDRGICTCFSIFASKT